MSNFIDHHKEKLFVNDFVSFMDSACTAFHATGNYFIIIII